MVAKTQADKDFFFATIPFEVSFRGGGSQKNGSSEVNQKILILQNFSEQKRLIRL